MVSDEDNYKWKPLKFIVKLWDWLFVYISTFWLMLFGEINKNNVICPSPFTLETRMTLREFIPPPQPNGPLITPHLNYLDLHLNANAYNYLSPKDLQIFHQYQWIILLENCENVDTFCHSVKDSKRKIVKPPPDLDLHQNWMSFFLTLTASFQ